MSKESGVILLGLFVAALPQLGFPQSLRDVFFTLAGLGLMALGFFLRADHLRRETGALPAPRDTESYPFAQNGQKRISDISPAEGEAR